MEIEKKTKEVTFYIVEGKEFYNEDDAKNYKKEIEQKLKYTYYHIGYKPDLTEGRGYYKQVIIAVPQSYTNNLLIHFLTKNLGSPLEFVMGVVPVDNWIIYEEKTFATGEELDMFLNTEYLMSSISGGGKKKLPVIYLDEHGNGDKELSK